MSEEEFEKQTLNNLITDLKDIDKYTTFKNGVFIYDLGKYQGTLLVNYIEQLQQENKQLKENYKFELEENQKLSDLWCKNNKILTELEEWLDHKHNDYKVLYKMYGNPYFMVEEYEKILKQIQKLKEKYK